MGREVYGRQEKRQDIQGGGSLEKWGKFCNIVKYFTIGKANRGENHFRMGQYMVQQAGS